MNDLIRNRIVEVIHLADKLKWIYPIEKFGVSNISYPLMELSEVEKCMIAMVDNTQFENMKQWVEELTQQSTADGSRK